MNRDLLELYEEGWDITIRWLNGPMTKSDLKPILKLVRARAESPGLSMKPSKKNTDNHDLRQVWAKTQGFLNGVAFAVGNQSFRLATVIVGTVAKQRALVLSKRRVMPPQESSTRLPGRNVRQHAIRAFETGLWIAAVGMLGYCSFVYASSALHQAQQKDLFHTREAQIRSTLSAFASASNSLIPASRVAQEGSLLGFLDIPRLGLSSVVEEGAAPSIVGRGVGHLPGTALPGESGNVELAGSLDSYFTELAKLRPGDILSFRSNTGTHNYSVVSTQVVSGAQKNGKVPQKSREPVLTLVTYFPRKTASAGKELVVSARELVPIDTYSLR
jgi:sortase A